MPQRNEVLAYFADLIERESGITYADHNFFQLENRLETLAKFNNCNSIDELYHLVKMKQSSSLLESIVDVSTNNETLFFRDEKMFTAIQELVKSPEIEAMSVGGRLNIWSAACSTGQEPISLSIALNEKLASNYSIFATDLSKRVLDTAKSGIYSDLQMSRGLSEHFKDKHFKMIAPNQWKVNENIHSRISYAQLNLKSPIFPDEKFHLILCRNVLLYQRENAKVEILKKLSSCLVKNGFLILGSGESTLGLSSCFQQYEVKGSFLYRLI